MKKPPSTYHPVAFSQHKAEVKEVFDRVSPHYERMNDVMSLGWHRLWRRILVAHLLEYRPVHAVLLDVAGGGGAVARDYLAQNPDARAIICDYSFDMLKRQHHHHHYHPRSFALQGDAEYLPIKDGSITHCACAYGLRNFTDYPRALRDMRRILGVGGRIAIMELGRVTAPMIGQWHAWYLSYGLPFLGRVVAGDEDSYRYLAQSIRDFAAPHDVMQSMKAAGFSSLRHRRLHGGVIEFYFGEAW